MFKKGKLWPLKGRCVSVYSIKDGIMGRGCCVDVSGVSRPVQSSKSSLLSVHREDCQIKHELELMVKLLILKQTWPVPVRVAHDVVRRLVLRRLAVIRCHCYSPSSGCFCRIFHVVLTFPLLYHVCVASHCSHYSQRLFLFF